MAAAFPQDGIGGTASRALAREVCPEAAKGKNAANRGGELSGQSSCTGRAGKMEDEISSGCAVTGRRLRARGLHARPIFDLDAHPSESAPRARGRSPEARDSRSR